ncbi:MAG TPA: hypothetical protein VF848_04965 [Steroidobacteraceae bacterium]
MFNQLQRWPLAALALALIGGWPDAAHACATCGCSLSSDEAMGFPAGAGWRLSFEYDYINQDELRSGSRSATPAAVVNSPSDAALSGGEIENSTLNRYFTFGIGYSPNPDWQFDLRLPYIERGHTTFGVQTAPYTAAETAPDQLSGAHVSALGDAKLIVSYLGLLPTSDLGVQLGLKLPTGSYGTKVDFNSGPAVGTPLDASLQAGTGSTDLIIGAFYHRPVSRNFDAFANIQYQVAVASKQDQSGNDFRVGNNSTVGLGLRYEADPRFVPQLQLNVFHKNADQGALADTTDTAGTVAYLSPGLTLRAQDRLHLFGFVQLPLLSNLSGYQLFPRWTASVGLSLSL